MSASRTDYRDLPAWCRPETIPQRPIARTGAALTAGEVVLCPHCHLPRSGRLVAVIEQRELVFVPERYCECEEEKKGN